MCLDCNKAIHLGKVFSDQNYRGFESWQFSFLEIKEGEQGSYDSMYFFQNFLITHRGHELRVLSEKISTFSKTADVPGEEIYADDTIDLDRATSLFDGVGMPDPDAEFNLYPYDITDRLRALGIRSE
jgi:hypothetical protein